MKLVLVRHGDALAKTVGQKDAERPLSPLGYEQLERAALYLQPRLESVRLFSSPFLRAMQSADVLRPLLADCDVAISDALKPNGCVATLTDAFLLCEDDCVVVSHQPLIGIWHSWLVDGELTAQPFQTGEVRILEGDMIQRSGMIEQSRYL